ncbi:flavodoxin domain-containing protein [Litoreibacter arenae]|uniref:Protoporphyrinogen oxidase n=1 Tax=Litoreibacter arenae DSM 19593 TaxID=1123360 RepID=S9QJL1_9RHOB|nr:flavodoxin domain-containing protein [Litoreibacter arenae]EPX79992.1 protoporphyrinogen oxidase [Litoreibacter arenae DSM 19593]
MTVLIIYATIEGQTGKIARFVETQLKDSGHNVRLLDASDKLAEVSFDGVDKVILAAPVHERRHPKPFEVLVTSVQKELAARETLLLSVSMNAAFPEGRDEAKDYVDEMVLRTGISPNTTLLVAGAVRNHRYDYYASQVLRHVVMRDREFDPNEESHEFTDWDAVKAAVEKFVGATETAN